MDSRIRESSALALCVALLAPGLAFAQNSDVPANTAPPQSASDQAGEFTLDYRFTNIFHEAATEQDKQGSRGPMAFALPSNSDHLRPKTAHHARMKDPWPV
jgi:hypothetical protein